MPLLRHSEDGADMDEADLAAIRRGNALVDQGDRWLVDAATHSRYDYDGGVEHPAKDNDMTRDEADSELERLRHQREDLTRVLGVDPLSLYESARQS